MSINILLTLGASLAFIRTPHKKYTKILPERTKTSEVAAYPQPQSHFWDTAV